MGRASERGVQPASVHALATRVLALDEPWRGRFLGLIAGHPGADGWDGVPSHAQLASRLTDRDVYRKVDGLLRMWVGPD